MTLRKLSLKERIHAFKIPIKNPYLLFAVKCFYFTAPIYGGYKIMEWTNKVRDENLGQNREKLLNRKRERQVLLHNPLQEQLQDDRNNTENKSSLFLPLLFVASTPIFLTSKGHHRSSQLFNRFMSSSSAQTQHFTSPSSAAAIARAAAPRSLLSTRLSQRSVISIRGMDAKKFLNGLTTNDIISPIAFGSNTNGDGKGIFTAFLNGKARTLSEAIITEDQTYLLRHSSTSSRNTIQEGVGNSLQSIPTLLIDVDSKNCESLVRHLKSHCLRSKVEIKDVSSTHKVTQILSSDPFSISEIQTDFNLIQKHLREEAGAFTTLNNTTLSTSNKTSVESSSLCFSVIQDPRMPEMLGLRVIAPSSVDIGSSLSLPTCNEIDYHALRFLLGVPEGNEVSGYSSNSTNESTSGSSTAVPLEWNVEMLNGVSFSKGCYLGQELVARTHFRGLVRRRYVPVYFTAHGSPPRQVACANPYTASITKETEGVRSHSGKASTSASSTPSPGGYGHGLGHGPSQTHDFPKSETHSHTSKSHSRIQPSHVIENTTGPRPLHTMRLPFPFIDRAWRGSLEQARSSAGAIIAGSGGGTASVSGVSLSGSKAGKLVAWLPGLNLGLVHMRLEPYLRHTLLSASVSGNNNGKNVNNGESVRTETALSAFKTLHNSCIGDGESEESRSVTTTTTGQIIDLSIDAGGSHESLYRVCPILPIYWTSVFRPLVSEE